LQDELPPILILIADEVADAAAAVLVTVDMVVLAMLDMDMDMLFWLLLAKIRLKDECRKRNGRGPEHLP
jgi:hypothetical protein